MKQAPRDKKQKLDSLKRGGPKDHDDDESLDETGNIRDLIDYDYESEEDDDDGESELSYTASEIRKLKRLGSFLPASVTVFARPTRRSLLRTLPLPTARGVAPPAVAISRPRRASGAAYAVLWLRRSPKKSPRRRSPRRRARRKSESLVF
jgi:hypothetical protein